MTDLRWDRRLLSDLMDLEPLGGGRFAARANEANAYGILFGGQLMGQALAAADQTVLSGWAHAFNIHFVRAGSVGSPLIYEVETVRDGRQSALRRVNAFQDGALIVTCMVDYRGDIDSFVHQIGPEPGLDVEAAIDMGALARTSEPPLPEYFQRFAARQPFEVRIPELAGFLGPKDTLRRHYWLRVPTLTGVECDRTHRHVLAYLTDVLMPGASLLPHTVPLPGPHLRSVTTSQAIWFHRPVRCDDWLLFETDSPSAASGTAISRCLIYDARGKLCASAVQEALQRIVA